MKKLVILFFLLFSTFSYANNLKEILEKNIIRIGINENTPPFASKNDKGEFIGFEIDLAEELVENISPKLEIAFIHIDKVDRLKALEDNRVDLIISSFTVTKERNEKIDFSSPYFLVNTGVLSRKIDAIRSINDLKNKKLAIIKNTTTYRNLKNDDYDLIFCKHPKECFSELEQQEADAFIGDDMVLFAYEHKNPNYEVAIKRVGKAEFLAIGIAKNNNELLKLINKIILDMHLNKRLQKIYNRNIAPIYDNMDPKQFLLDDFYKNVLMTDDIE